MELQGFKSFADRTTLTFAHGITAIVGPNGSGKSNISDAVRWVMGEQNVRHLRGQKSEDIIFAGTEKRRPQGAAEVSLYFDNSQHELDVDFTEVVITRRIFRSGESEFFINKRPCRLKDIHLLFADTGIGQDSMAVISQNRVDAILNSKPEERRLIFEEAAGISRYKSRKQEGLRKIAETEHNLERIHDMMGVLEEQLVPLKAQAERLTAFRALDSERISYAGTLALQELRNAERLLSKAENNRIAATGEYRALSRQTEATEAAKKELLAVMEQESADLRRLDEETLTVHNELDSMKSRQEAFVTRQEELLRSHVQLQEEEAETKKKQAHIQAQQGQSVHDLAQRQAACEAARQGFNLTQSVLAKAEEKVSRMQAALSQVQAENTEKAQNLFILKRDIEDLRRRLDENRQRAEELERQQTEETEKAAQAQSRQHEGERSLCEAQEKLQTWQAELEEVMQKQQLQSRETSRAEQEYRQLKGQAAALQQRIHVLESMEQEHEGAGLAAKTVLEARAAWQADVCGLVGELCTLPAEYVTAMDIALGGASRYIVTRTEETAKEAIAYLRQRRAGRTTFLPLDTVKERRRTADELAAAKEKGILGFASDLIQYDAAYARIFSSLLGKTLIAESQADASQTARKYGHRLRIVCLDGTLFNAGGSLTGGSNKNREGSLLSRRATIQSLQTQWHDTDQRLQALTKEGEALRQQLTDAASQAEAVRKAVQEEQLAVQQLTWQLEQAKTAAAEASQTSSQASQQLQHLYDSRSEIQAALWAKEEELTTQAAPVAADTAKLEAGLSQAQAELASCRQALTERQVALATLQEQVRHIQAQQQQQQDLADQAAGEWQRLSERRHQLQQRQAETKQLLQELATNIAAKEQETAAKDQEKKAFYAAREANFHKNQELDQQLSSLRANQEKWNHQVHTAEMQAEKYRSEISRSEEHLARQGLTREQALERRREGSLKELTEHLARLQEQMAALGQINPNADTDYEQAVAKQQFYRTQCDDLLESRKRLQTVVAEIDDAMSQQFTQAFGVIGGHFQRIFSQLFGGGKAQISLTDKSDVLNAGVEITIQPPGKKQQTLTLLSGGERALTVIALLLAFQAYHPAPFILFDEVDAALDEANVIRMADYMKKYSKTTQFIVITHRRKTMEAADTLQGVTMEEKGISRLLTVKVDDVMQKGS